MELFEDEDVCPLCKTRRVTMPSLVLKYTTCCGQALCTECIEAKFRGKKKVQCMKCQEEMKLKDFVQHNFDAQKYDAGNLARRGFSSYLMQRRDFDTDGQYEDYLEEEQDIIYDMVYGTPEEKEASQRKRKELFNRVNEYRKSNATKLAKFASEDRSKGANKSKQSNVSDFKDKMPALLPATWEGPNPVTREVKNWKLHDEQLAEQIKNMPQGEARRKQERNYLYSMKLRKALIPYAGGFLTEYDQKRGIQESWDALGL